MIDIKTFPSYFENAKPIDCDTFDLRFEEAISLVEQDQFDQAVPIIESILKEGCLDIRLIIHLFYAHFLEEGLPSLLTTFPYLMTMLREQWENLSPALRRESHATKSIIWFLLSINKKMKRSSEIYKEQRTDFLWSNAASLPLITVEEVEKCTKALMDFFTRTWKLPSSQEYMHYILKWLKEVKSLPRKAPPPLETSPSEKTPLQIDEAPAEKKPEFLPERSPAPSSDPAAEKNKSPLEEILTASKKMEELYGKLKLFETLIAENNFTKGSLVGADIKNTIENFNPAIFFPKLFSRYYALVAEHIDTLITEWQSKGSPKWESLEQLYQTDLEAFIKW